jgi:serine/threonine-protein kinase HipA
MAGRPQVAEVTLWGATIGALSWNPERQLASFQYSPAFLSSGIELAPLTMPLSDRTYSFPELNRDSFLGLPGMLADALPDKFGHKLINAWLIREGKSIADFSPVERLLYIGSRGMGALEFKPARYSRKRNSEPLDLAELVKLANEVLANRSAMAVRRQPEMVRERHAPYVGHHFCAGS